jgi:hypothetical protein
MSGKDRPTGIPAVDNFVSGFDSEEKSRAQVESLQAMIKQFDDGAPIPPANPHDLKQFWDVSRRINTDMPPRPGVAIGLGIFASYGFEAASAGAEKYMPVEWRHELMSSLIKRGVLKDYVHGEELDEKVFAAAATMPCDKTDVAETMLPFLFSKSSKEDAAKAMEEMRAGGYDPDKPNIDGKFLDWLQNNC